MELTNNFRVSAPVERAWEVLTDVERIAPCLPGAELQEVEGHVYRGAVKVKVGPIAAQYKGQATFIEQDAEAHRAVLSAEGRETRGQGNAKATITATLTADGDETAVSVVTDLTVTGKVAQFGRNVLGDVSAKLLGQFAACLETKLVGEGAEATANPNNDHASDGNDPAPVTTAQAPSATPPPAVRRIDSHEAKPVDLLDVAGGSVAKRVGPVVALVAIGWLLRRFLRRR